METKRFCILTGGGDVFGLHPAILSVMYGGNQIDCEPEVSGSARRSS